jgi:hypothetical protein
MRVCIDFGDLNRATPMDGYPMPVADLLVDAAAGHKVISFMDGNAWYNQILWQWRIYQRQPSDVLDI